MTEEQLLLITAAVDAELSERDRSLFHRLLDSSNEARAIYAKLKADCERLRKLPQVKPPANLQPRVMAKVKTLTPHPIAVPAPRQLPYSRKSRHWAPIAIAASLLLGVASSSFWFFTRDSGNSTATRNPNRPPPATKQGASDPAWANWLPADGSRLPSAPMPQERNGSNVAHNEKPPAVPPVEPVEVAIAPTPRDAHGPLHASPFTPEIPPFNFLQVRVPFLQPLMDFDRENVRQQLLDELGRDPAFRIDIFARDTARGVQFFQNASAAVGLKLHSDATTMNLLRKGQIGSVVVYTDSLTAVEITALLAKLSAEDAKITPRVFDAVHATPVGRSDESEIRNVLGTDPGLFKRAIPTHERGKKEMEKGGSVSAGTADQIVKSITSGKGRPVEGSAVLLTWTPSQGRTPPANSAELKAFLAKRGERKPDAVPVIIVIRHGNG